MKKEITTHTLPNGLKLVHVPAAQRVGWCGLIINAGSRDDHASRLGLAHFVEHTIFKGTTHRRAWHILNRMETVGGELNAYTTKEGTALYSVFPEPYLKRAMELIADLVMHSVFPEAEIEREKDVVLEEVASYRDEAEKQFGAMHHRLCRPARVTPAILPPEQKVVDFGLHQSHTIVGARVPGMYDDSRFALALLNNQLAGPGMNSLLNVLMRERRGLVYTVESSIASFTDCGLLEIYFGCEQNKVKKSLDIIGKTIDQLAQSPLSTSRLEAAKRQYCGQLLVASQSVEATALGAGKSVLYWNQVPNVDRTVERIKAVTAEQVRQAAELITPPHASILTFQ